VTVNDWATPAVVAGKPVTRKDPGVAEAVTLTPDWVALSPALAVSVTVTDWVPAVFRAALKVWAPPSLFVKV